MTYAEFRKNVATRMQGTEAEADRYIRGIFELIKHTPVGEKVSIQKSGSFETVFTKPRVGRNPQTGEAIEIPAKLKLKFKASK